jgi:MAF protein
MSTSPDTIVLASASPRRRELLTQIGVPHVVLAVDIDESAQPGEAPAALARRLAREKAVAGRMRDGGGRAALGSDTIVVLDGEVYGKPRDAADARRMLGALSGRSHEVMSAVALALPGGGPVRDALSVTEVRMRALAPAEIDAYWRSGEPRDKAGGYAVQGLAAVIRRTSRRQLFWRDGTATVRDRGAARRIRHPSARGDGLMSAEILINVGPGETRGAVLENGVLQEIFIERASRRGIVGNIYKGRVSRVLPGMQAAFVEVGLERTAFLHVDDIEPKAGEATAAAGASRDIRQLLSAGDDVIVQVAKDPLGGKGARLSTSISLPSRLLVYMPRGSGVGVSARIDDEAERSRLRDTILGIVKTGHSGGYIVRTAAVGATPAQLASDLEYLERLWAHVREGSARDPPAISCTRTCRWRPACCATSWPPTFAAC